MTISASRAVRALLGSAPILVALGCPSATRIDAGADVIGDGEHSDVSSVALDAAVDSVDANGSERSVVPRCALASMRPYTFESFAPGTAMLPGWATALDGPSTHVRVSLPAEGLGANGSNAYLLLLNNGVARRVMFSTQTPSVDATDCRRAVLRAVVIAFSMEALEGDRAFIDLRTNGGVWSETATLFPSTTFRDDPNCRPGMQATGCAVWTEFRIDVPPSLLTRDLEARFRVESFTDRSDAIGVDDVVWEGD